VCVCVCVCVCVQGLMAVNVVYPFDVVRRRMQTHEGGSALCTCVSVCVCVCVSVLDGGSAGGRVQA
jgi:hypothetical protein